MQASTMALYENLAAGVVTFLPSKQMFYAMINETRGKNEVYQQVRWRVRGQFVYDGAGRCAAATAMHSAC